jgi:hypothetical protein
MAIRKMVLSFSGGASSPHQSDSIFQGKTKEFWEGTASDG